MLRYEDRVNYLDTFLNLFSTDANIKFNILANFHYLSVLVIYIWFVLTKNKKVFWVLFIIILIQLVLNIIDDGCFLMKLERKYVGKEWYGGYHILEYIGVDVNKDVVKDGYIIIMIMTMAVFLYKLL
jgi:hypothetical protein